MQGLGQGSWGRLLVLSGAPFHPALKNEDSGYAIHRLATFSDGEIGFTEEAVGFGGGQALVPEVDWEFEVLAEFFGKSLDFLCLNAFGTAHAEGQADYDFLDLVFTDYTV